MTDLDKIFFTRLIEHTRNFGNVTWMGRPIWQNLFDIWSTQEVVCSVQPELIIECGTNRGGSAFFLANLMDLMQSNAALSPRGETSASQNKPSYSGRIITIDVESLNPPAHPRVQFLIGSSVSEEVTSFVRGEVAKCTRPVMVILDSDHSAQHVVNEFEAYCGFVTPGSYMLVQDGVIDVLDTFVGGRPGPLLALEHCLARHPEFAVDQTLCDKFLISHHPKGWLRRIM